MYRYLKYSKCRLLLLNLLLVVLIVLILRESIKESQHRDDEYIDRYKTLKTHLPRIFAKHRLAIIVPYRDRENELKEFVPYMSKFLHQQNLDFKLFVINQVDEFRFNRAMLINIGWNLSKNEGYDYFAMHDVDLLPQNFLIKYEFPGDVNALHLTPPGIHPRYNYPTFIGGILLLSHNLFEKVNGMSNRYWGWGLEDDEFYLRLKDQDSKVLRPSGITTGHKTFRHIHDKVVRIRDQKKTADQWRISRQRDYYTGLSTLKDSYEVVSTDNNFGIQGCQVIDVRLKCDLSATPWCEPIQ